MSQTVQFRGKDKAIQAFEKREVNAFAVFSGKQLLLPFIAESNEDAINALQEYLDMIETGGNSIYTLKVYEGLTPGQKITDKTPCDGSFNFRLREWQPDEGYPGNWSAYNKLKEENDQLKQRLDELEEAPEDNSIMGRIGQIAETEAGQAIISRLGDTLAYGLQKIIDGMMNPGQKQQQQQAYKASIGHITEADQQISAAVAILKACDPKIGEHLLKLAAVAQNDPTTFNFLIKQLEKM